MSDRLAGAPKVSADLVSQTLTAQLSPTAKAESIQNEHLKIVVKELSEDSSLFKLYKSTFVENDLAPLREKTVRQVKAMRQYAESRIQPESARSGKFQEFRDFAHQLTPVRSDNNQSLTEFLSPRRLGLDQGDHLYDASVQGGAYVYGSFDGLPHGQVGINSSALGENFDDSELIFDQTRIAEQDPELSRKLGIRRLDDTSFDQTAHVVMMDVADMLYSANRHNAGLMRAYLTNCFTYTEGKELLAYYLASVFDTADEARMFMSRAGRMFAEKWDVPAVTASLMVREPFTLERVTEIQTHMFDVFNALGIMPPAQLEIRIRDHAPIKAGW